MARTILLTAAALLMLVANAFAEYLEIEASEIATIAGTGREASPRILVKWTLPEELSDVILDGAALTMTLARDTTCQLDVTVYPLTHSWTANTVQWSGGWTRDGGDYNDSLPSPALASEQNGGKISALVTDFVVNQVAGRATNFGFIVVPDPESECRIAEMTANDAGRLSNAKLVIAYRQGR